MPGSDKRYLSKRAMAAELNRSLTWFYRHWAQLVEDRVIPPPLPGRGQLRWDRAELDAWREAMAAARRRPVFGDQSQAAIEDRLLANIALVMKAEEAA